MERLDIIARDYKQSIVREPNQQNNCWPCISGMHRFVIRQSDRLQDTGNPKMIQG